LAATRNGEFSIKLPGDLLGLAGGRAAALLPLVRSETLALCREVSMMSELVAIGRIDTCSLAGDVTDAF